MSNGHRLPPSFKVQLPAGGELELQSLEEVELWETSRDKYIADFHLTQQNDLMLVGAILSQQLLAFRAQQRINGMVPELDDQGKPTGKYRRGEVKPGDMSAAQSTLIKAATEIRELEKALGVDKKTRESGGAHTVANYVETLKMATRAYGIHISKRVTEYEKVMMEARWKLRLLRNGDPEDRNYHGLTEQSFIKWLEGELARIEEIDRQFAKEKGKLFVGRV